MMLSDLLSRFDSPGAECRGKPFWAWNSKLDPDELRNQIRQMKKMGLGGFFMHSRVGLATEYLGEDWFDCIAACVDEAEKCGLEAWLYDEDRWPSGAAGGLVTRNPEYRMREIVLNNIASVSDFHWDQNTLAVFYASELSDGLIGTPRYFFREAQLPVPEKDESIYEVRWQAMACSPFYNGYTHLDTMNEEAVAEFIRVTHEEYCKRFGENFGKIIPGIFTDEPGYGRCLSPDSTITEKRSSLPWTGKLPEVFRERYGYDLVSGIAELFFNIDGCPPSRIRYHYFDCVTHLFVTSYAQQIGEWCEKHGLQFTGHVLNEDTPSTVAGVCGSSMRFYEHMQAPGLDLLTAGIRAYDPAKQVSSVARQFGRRWRLTETYGCTGWDFSFAGHKALGDWQAALGINLRCQHLAWYSMQGQAKRDYPASISAHSPWWEEYGFVEDYFARINSVLSHGKEVRDLLVIHPGESSWLLVRRGWDKDPAVKQSDESLRRLRDTLLAAHIDFDYGDEEIISRLGKIEVDDYGPGVTIGFAQYRTLLVPPMLTIRRRTLEILKRFHANGGNVVFAGPAPVLVDAEPSEDARKFSEYCFCVNPFGAGLVSAVECSRRIKLLTPEGEEIAPLLYQLREDDDAYNLFVCNVGHDFQRHDGLEGEPLVDKRTLAYPDVRISVPFGSEGIPLELDAETGRVCEAEVVSSLAGERFVQTSFDALESRLFVFQKRKTDIVYPRRPRLKQESSKILEGDWDYRLHEDNVLLLDCPRFRIGSDDWSGPEDILQIDHLVRKRFGLPKRGGAMVQPWARTERPSEESLTVKLEYEFSVEQLPDAEEAIYLGLEVPEFCRAKINGIDINLDDDCGWWVDKSLRKIMLPCNSLCLGSNRLMLEINYSAVFSGLENIYLLGNFGVRVCGNRVSLCGLPGQLNIGDWTARGLPFYSGNLSYCRKIVPGFKENERLVLDVPRYCGTGFAVMVDGNLAGIRGWEPNRIDITDFVHDGVEALLEIKILSHRRNSHGPFHNKNREVRFTGPAQFEKDFIQWQDAYQLVPCGLMAEPVLSVFCEVSEKGKTAKDKCETQQKSLVSQNAGL